MRLVAEKVQEADGWYLCQALTTKTRRPCTFIAEWVLPDPARPERGWYFLCDRHLNQLSQNPSTKPQVTEAVAAQEAPGAP